MSQTVVVSARNHVKVVQSGPRGLPGRDGTNGVDGVGVANATGAATLEDGVIHVPIDPAVDVAGARTLGSGALQALPGDTTPGDIGAEEEGVASDLITAMREAGDSPSVKQDLSAAGLIKFNRWAKVLSSGPNIVSTIADSALHASPISYPLAEMALASSGFRVVAYGNHMNNSGSAAIATFRLKLNGTTVYTFAPTIPTAAGARWWRFEADFRLIDFLGSRIEGPAMMTFGSNVANGFDLGTISDAPDTAAYTLAASNPIALTVQHAAAVSTISTQMFTMSIHRFEAVI